MSNMVWSINQVRKWANTPPGYLVNGYSQTHDLFYTNDSKPRLDLPAGGWTLSASTNLYLEWESTIAQEGIYRVFMNQERIYAGLWTPKLGETVTETFCVRGDLLAINYRLLRVTE